MAKDYSKCSFIDAWMLPNSFRTNKKTADTYKNFPEKVYISYIDNEDNQTKIDEFDPIYEYYEPVNDYFVNKEKYDNAFKSNPNWVEEFNKIATKGKELYIGIDDVVCEKRVCKTYKDFNKATHGYTPIKYRINNKNIKFNKTGDEPSEYGTAIEHQLNMLEKFNEIRKEQGLYPLKRKHLIYESTHSIVFKTLIRNFSSSDKEVILNQPELKVCFFDIEVDVRMDEEFPNATKAQLPINCVSMYNAWEDRNITIALCPNRPYERIAPITLDEAKRLCADLPDTIVVGTEEELLNAMLDNLSKCHIMSGWNSSAFDIVYFITRVKNVLGEKATHKLNMIDVAPVPTREINRTGQSFNTYQLVGRMHIDYLILYKHHNPKQQPSYKLDFIGKLETGEGKEEYDGSLERLYHRDFRKFVEYNRQDAALLKKIDDKVKFIQLTNALAHKHGVTFDALMKTVSWVDQWQINNAHFKGRICPDRTLTKEEYERQNQKRYLISRYNQKLEQYHPESPLSPYYDWNDYGAPGAWVNMPFQGVAFNMSSYDINSLYPSIMRSINVGIEAIVGRVRQNYTAEYMKNKCIAGEIYDKKKKKIPNYTQLWLHEWAIQEMKMIWDKTNDIVTIDFEDGKVEEHTAAEWNKIIFEDHANDWNISANGTIFNSTKQAITAYTMEKGYAERKGFQKIMRMYEDCHDGASVSTELEESLKEFVVE